MHGEPELLCSLKPVDIEYGACNDRKNDQCKDPTKSFVFEAGHIDAKKIDEKEQDC